MTDQEIALAREIGKWREVTRVFLGDIVDHEPPEMLLHVARLRLGGAVKT